MPDPMPKHQPILLLPLLTAFFFTPILRAAESAPTPIKLKAEPFDLSDVRLLDSPFKHAQELDEKYLLSLDPDRLLHNFRVNAGLPSIAQPLGGWEAPTCELRGHFVGHYLSACSLMYKSTGDEQFKNRADYIVTELAKCQAALGGEYLSAFPESYFERLESGKKVWAPYYTIHKIMAGLLDSYQLCGNAQALDMTKKMADYFQGRLSKLSPEQIDRIFHTSPRGGGTEFGGMSESLHDLYAITNNPDYLALADTFDRPWFLDPLADGQDELAGLHANTHIPQVEGFAWHYQLTGDEKYRLASVHFWEIVTGRHSFVTGSNSFGEHFVKPGVEAAQLSPSTAETCNTYNMLKLTRQLFEWDPKAQYADYYERALYNHILASIDPDSGMMIYYLALAPGYFKTFCTPTNSFWCCTGTGVENHAKYGDSIYFHNDKALWVNLYIPSELHWKQNGLTLRQETGFPVEQGTKLVMNLDSPTTLALNLRVPYWATQGVTVKINGAIQPVSAQPESYLTLNRQWNDGDTVELSMPMSLHIHHASDMPDHVAVMYGPLVLAGELGRARFPAIDQAPDPGRFFRIPPTTAPSLPATDSGIKESIKSTADQPLRFTVSGLGDSGGDVTLLPLYQVNHERYVVYWKMK